MRLALPLPGADNLLNNACSSMRGLLARRDHLLGETGFHT